MSEKKNSLLVDDHDSLDELEDDGSDNEHNSNVENVALQDQDEKKTEILPGAPQLQVQDIGPRDTSDAKLLSTYQNIGLVNVKTGAEIITEQEKLIFNYARQKDVARKVNYKKCTLGEFTDQYSTEEKKHMEAGITEDHNYIKEMAEETKDWAALYNINDPTIVEPANITELSSREKDVISRYIVSKGLDGNNITPKQLKRMLYLTKMSRVVRHRFMRANMKFDNFSEKIVPSTKSNLVRDQLATMRDSGIIKPNEFTTYRTTVIADMRKARSNMFEYFTLDLFSTDEESDLYSFIKSNAFSTNMNKTVFVGFNPRTVRNQFFSNVYNYMKKKGTGGFSTATKISHISENSLMKKNIAVYSRTILTQIITLLMTRGTNMKKYKNNVNATRYCSNLIKLLFVEFHVYPKNVPGTSNFLSYPRIASSYPVISSYVCAQVPPESMVLRDFNYLPLFAQHNNFACLIPLNFTSLAQVAFVWNVKFSEIINSKKDKYVYKGTIFLAMLCTKMLSQLEKMWYIRRMLLDHEISPLAITDGLDVSGALSSINQDILNDKSYKSITRNGISMNNMYEAILKDGMDADSNLLVSADYTYDGEDIVDPMKL